MKKKMWNKVYFQLYKENMSKPVCVCRARKIALEESGDKFINVTGTLEDFFPLMGSILELISEPSFGGSKQNYVICWVDDSIEDEKKMWKKLVGVKFLESIDTIGTCEKQRYRGRFIAKELIE